MDFENEATYLRAAKEGKVEEFQRSFDKALEMVEEEFGQIHPIYIAGEELYCKETFEDRSPSNTERLLGTFQRARREDASRAVKAAELAFREWSRTDWQERVRIFRRAADILADQKYTHSAIMCHENGKNRLEAMADVDEAIDFIHWYCSEVERNEGFDQDMESSVPGERTRSILRPYGVWVVVSPFNFPLAITCGMTTGAVLTGNTAVLKPASDTPYMGLRLYETLEKAGLPDGVLNLVTGRGSTVGAELVESPRVSGLAFTGSRQVGVASFKAFNRDFPKPVITELGGKNPVIVTDGADLEKAVSGVGLGAFGFGGQKCSAASRVYLHEDIRDDFLERLVSWTRELRIGDPTERDTYLGPLINARSYENYQKYAALAAKDGRVLTGGQVLRDGPLGKGYFVEPTIVDGLSQDHPLFREELFVPLLCIYSIGSLEEGIQLANDSEYGLCAGLFTEDPEERETFFRDIHAGVAYCNREQGATTGAIVGAQPFSGWKHSGISGKGAGARYYLQQFLREQSLTYYT
ncbi:MAG: aldehyde dehydrogenase family protein [Thermoplasmata archaeon]